jgi:hypothetical protein
MPPASIILYYLWGCYGLLVLFVSDELVPAKRLEAKGGSVVSFVLFYIPREAPCAKSEVRGTEWRLTLKDMKWVPLEWRNAKKSKCCINSKAFRSSENSTIFVENNSILFYLSTQSSSGDWTDLMRSSQ